LLLLSKIERHMNYLRQVVRILQQPSIFVRKEVSIPNSRQLTKLYNPLTDSLRPFSVESALISCGVALSIHAN
jgi:hypothetical protein